MKRFLILITVFSLTMVLVSVSFAEDRLVVKNGSGDATFKVSDGGDIFTTSPLGGLHVSGTASSDLFAGMGVDLANGPAFNFGYAGSSFGQSCGFFNVRPDASATYPNPSLRFMTQNIERMIVTGDGSVGIGTSNPSAKLYVVGDIHCTGNLTQGSARELKENIVQLTASEAVKAFRDLDPVTYNYKSNKSESCAGFIADDVPELLAVNGRKGLSSMDFVAVLVKVIQEQQKVIAVNNARITALETRNQVSLLNQ